MENKTREDAAKKMACQILREHFIGLDHPNIDAYDDDYVIRNYPFEYGLFMKGWQASHHIPEQWIMCWNKTSGDFVMAYHIEESGAAHNKDKTLCIGCIGIDLIPEPSHPSPKEEPKPIEGDGWISVNDKKPDDSMGRVLVWVNEVNDLGISKYCWNCSYSERHGFTDNGKHYNVTHWQPLPSPPIH